MIVSVLWHLRKFSYDFFGNNVQKIATNFHTASPLPFIITSLKPF